MSGNPFDTRLVSWEDLALYIIWELEQNPSPDVRKILEHILDEIDIDDETLYENVQYEIDELQDLHPDSPFLKRAFAYLHRPKEHTWSAVKYIEDDALTIRCTRCREKYVSGKEEEWCPGDWRDRNE